MYVKSLSQTVRSGVHQWVRVLKWNLILRLVGQGIKKNVQGIEVIRHSVACKQSCNLCRYATACARSDGLLLLCGGRDATSVVCYQNLHKAANFNMS